VTLPILPRKTAIDAVKAALLLVDGQTSGNYFFDIKNRGLATELTTAAEVTPDQSPWVVVKGGDGALDYEAAVNTDKKQETMDVTVWGILKPDEARLRGYAASDLLELLIGDVVKTVELNARTLSCGSITALRYGIALDPRGEYAFVEFTLSYRLRSNLGT